MRNEFFNLIKEMLVLPYPFREEEPSLFPSGVEEKRCHKHTCWRVGSQKRHQNPDIGDFSLDQSSAMCFMGMALYGVVRRAACALKQRAQMSLLSLWTHWNEKKVAVTSDCAQWI
ncbi:unnamed protein product [Larinioides sclopetarius]|uniref:Uncharacterized protein n=1 Tax=Larinioides sclopetarius TaxID=280406 RepID=A0AAV2B656_9ARAC